MTTVNLPSAETGAQIENTTTYAPYEVGDGITVVPSYLPVPGMGVLPVHAYIIDGPEPMLVDTGLGGNQDAFSQALTTVIEPSALRWLWLTHTDPDHTGALEWIIANAPELRIITTFVATAKLTMQMDVPMNRLMWVNPGTSIEVNGRSLHALRPPTFDAPETVAFHDQSSSTLFSADSFGALLQSPTADAADVSPSELTEGMTLWPTIDSPWITDIDRSRFAQTLETVESLGAKRVLSAHLPPASGMTEALVSTLATVPGRQPWTGPDQAALDQILAAVTG
jgi:hypothetical protein